MKKRTKHSKPGFDARFDKGDEVIDFSKGLNTPGLSKVVKLPPITIPAWLAAEIDRIAQMQANSKAAVVRQLLVEAITAKSKASPNRGPDSRSASRKP